MFNLIYTGDTIDQGRKKINAMLFTGITANGYWSPLNSGATSVSLEFSALTDSYLSNNQDVSLISNNLIIGTNNILSGFGGYNFVNGDSNILFNITNSFISGYNNNVAGLSNSFIKGFNNQIYSGNYVTFIGSDNITINPNTLNNNYISILGSSDLNIMGGATNKHLNYFTSLNNSGSSIFANCDYVTIMNGANNIISGTVKNVVIFGSNNLIGFNQNNATTYNFENIYIFGNGIKPILSANTMQPLSGTYINDLCIENQLLLNHDNQTVGVGVYPIPVSPHPYPNPNPELYFNKNNIGFITTARGTGQPNFASTATAVGLPHPSLSGLFFAVYKNSSNCVSSLVGDTSYFVDNYNGAYNGRWDIPSNRLSGNTVFMTKIPGINKFIKIKG